MDYWMAKDKNGDMLWLFKGEPVYSNGTFLGQSPTQVGYNKDFEPGTKVRLVTSTDFVASEALRILVQQLRSELQESSAAELKYRQRLAARCEHAWEREEEVKGVGIPRIQRKCAICDTVQTAKSVKFVGVWE